MNIIEALDDPNLFGGALRNPSTFTAWRSFLKALFALPMTLEELKIYQECTGRQLRPTVPLREAWLPCGRRGRKSFILALIATFLATCREYQEYLGHGELATIAVLSEDRKSARVIFRYVKGLLNRSPMLADMIVRETQQELELSNGVIIEICTASERSTRGYNYAAVLCDELAFWPTDEESDEEILRAIRPGMKTIPTSMLLCASSPYAKRGALWKAYAQHYGVDGAPIVWKAPTRVMNPTIPQEEIDKEYADDPVSAASEYGAEFRSDVESFLPRENIEACVPPGLTERPFVWQHSAHNPYRYFGFVDASGGSNDSMTLAISHQEGGKGVLDAIRVRKPPFSPEAVVREFTELLTSYGLKEVTGDRYGGDWPRERFRVNGINYNLAEKPKSDIYREFLPLVMSREVELLDHKPLVAELCALERRTARGGRDTIDHPARGHDDIANVVAGSLIKVSGRRTLSMLDVL